MMNNSSDINFVKIFDMNGNYYIIKKSYSTKILDNNPNLIQVNTNNIVHTFKFINQIMKHSQSFIVNTNSLFCFSQTEKRMLYSSW